MEWSNHFLASLSKADLALIQPDLMAVELVRDDVLIEAGDRLRIATLPAAAIVSVLAVMKDGRAVESRTIGRESGYGLQMCIRDRFWNLQQLGGSLTLVSDRDSLIDALNGFAAAYRSELTAAMLARLGLSGRSADEDLDFVNAAFRALASGGEVLRWEPFFFDWFGGDEARAMASARAEVYGGEGFAEFRTRLASYQAERPERLTAAYFQRAEPQELLIDEIEAIWADIAERDDWSAFYAKLAGLEEARAAYAL